MPDRVAPGLGDRFGVYTIESLLGRGGMGTVYLAMHERLRRKVALKLIAAELAEDDDFRARFLRESQLAASLDHPNVIPIYDANEIDGVLYLAMRYVDGPSLRDRIRDLGRLSPEETLRIAQQIGGALDAAHARGLVHRDVKPANILLAEAGGHAYLCDFGLAKRTSSRGTTRTGSFLGSVDYCAPEQIQGQAVEGRTDVYALGCVLYHCLTGQPPYARDTEFAVLRAHLEDPPPRVSATRPELPARLDPVLAKAMAKPPDDRYATAGALAAAFAAALHGEDEAEATRVAPPSPAATPAARQRPTRLRWALVAAALVVAALALAAGLVLGSRDSNGSATSDDAALRTFVDRVENVLAQSAAGRREIASALADGFDCAIPPRTAAARIASVADNRESVLVQIGTLPAPTAEADEVVTLLQRSLQESIEADRHYRDGFQALPPRAKCPLARGPAFALAAASDARATRAKARFIDAFNPLAQRFRRKIWTTGMF
jgi:hypothetical protein